MTRPGARGTTIGDTSTTAGLFAVWIRRATGIEGFVPLYCCRACGFATTASWRNAVMAHHVGSPECGGELAMAVSFAARSPESGRVRAGAEGGESATEDGDAATNPARGSA